MLIKCLPTQCVWEECLKRIIGHGYLKKKLEFKSFVIYMQDMKRTMIKPQNQRASQGAAYWSK